MTVDNWFKALDLASIAFYLMVITIAVLLYTSRSPHKSTKK